MNLAKDIMELKKQLLVGDESAFQELYFIYYPLLLKYGKAFSNDLDLIQDQIQDLFVKIWQDRKKFAQLENPDAYLYSGFRNNIINSLNKVKNRKQLLEQNKALNWQENKNYDIEYQEKNTALEYLNNLIQDLPPKQREVLFLRFFQEKSFKEIAEIMSISSQVAQNYANRAIKKLRTHAPTLEKLLYPLLLFMFGNF